MASNASRGAHYKARSKKYLQRQGFQVADMETLRTIWTVGGPVCVKRDAFGSDLMYLTKEIVVFVQVKGGLKALTTLIKDARRAFDAHAFPVHTRQELHVWRPFSRQPEIVTWP
jgi:hypothetical protein